MPRPDVAPRPVCRYYNNTARGCFAGDKCRYLHGDPAVQKYAPYEENKTCRFYAQGYCKRGNECWFKHIDADVTIVSKVDTEEDVSCGICFEEKPALYGLLTGCSHSFCLTCIRQWRDPENKGLEIKDSGIHKTCPMCRLGVKFVIPSSRFFPQGDPRKAAVIENYKQSMAKVPCRWFVSSKHGNRFCPFGKDCFYQHIDDDGTPYEFKQGVDEMMTGRRFGSYGGNSVMDPLQAALQVLEGFAETIASDDHGPEGSDAQRAIIDMHVTDLLRIMGHGPALRTLATLEQMAGEAEDEVPNQQPTDQVDPAPSSPAPFISLPLRDQADLNMGPLESPPPQSTHQQQCQPLTETRERDGQSLSSDTPPAINTNFNIESHPSEERIAGETGLSTVDEENSMNLSTMAARTQIVGEGETNGVFREHIEDSPSPPAPISTHVKQLTGEGEASESDREGEWKRSYEQEQVQEITPPSSRDGTTDGTRSSSSTPNRSSDLAGNGAVYYSPYCPWMIPERDSNRISNFAWMMPRTDVTVVSRSSRPIRDQEDAGERTLGDID